MESSNSSTRSGGKGKYEPYAKKTIRVPIAVPQSSAAERTSTRRNKSMGGDDQTPRYTTEGQHLTVVFCPPVEMSSPDHKIENKTDKCPRYIIHCGCWRYPTCASQHHRNAE
jgi:hypothetical protein